MSVGVAVTKGDIDRKAGDIARLFQTVFSQGLSLNDYFTRTPNADLVALGYTDQEVATLKTAMADAAQLWTIYSGAAALPAAKDFRTFLQQLAGLGAI